MFTVEQNVTNETVASLGDLVLPQEHKYPQKIPVLQVSGVLRYPAPTQPPPRSGHGRMQKDFGFGCSAARRDNQKVIAQPDTIYSQKNT
jgi:hypothetical protein